MAPKKKTEETAPVAVSHPFADARRASVPLVMYETSDPAATIRMVQQNLNGSADITPMLSWDCSRVLTPENKLGAELVNGLNVDPVMISNPAEFLAFLQKPENAKQFARVRDAQEKLVKWGAIIFWHNAHRMLTDTVVMQATWNLRDMFKAQQTCLVMLVTPGSKPPVELSNDVITLTDPKPGPAEAAKIIQRIAEAAQKRGAEIDPAAVANDEKTVDRTLGLSGFGIEQIVSMSVRKTGLDVPTLTRRQKTMIEQTDGLSVMAGNRTREQIAGNRNVLDFIIKVVTGGQLNILFLDEIDKSLGAGQGDTSGTSADQQGVFLKVTQNKRWPGIMLLGPGGTGKSEIAKLAASIGGCVGIEGDLGACKGSLVGESEQKIRAMFDTVSAVTQDKVLIVATCNRMAALTPEIRRRFKLGTFFVDLLDEEGRAACWKIKRKMFGIDDSQPTPANCDGWTGAEIEQACEVAFRTGCTLAEATQFVSPLCISAKDEIDALRKSAHNKFISAAQPGPYQYRPLSLPQMSALPVTTSREFNL